jgi:hypothetical protein
VWRTPPWAPGMVDFRAINSITRVTYSFSIFNSVGTFYQHYLTAVTLLRKLALLCGARSSTG